MVKTPGAKIKEKNVGKLKLPEVGLVNDVLSFKYLFTLKDLFALKQSI